MKIIIETSTGLVVEVAKKVIKKENGLLIDDRLILGFSKEESNRYSVIEFEKDLPDGFRISKYLYLNGEFSINPSYKDTSTIEKLKEDALNYLNIIMNEKGVW